MTIYNMTLSSSYLVANFKHLEQIAFPSGGYFLMFAAKSKRSRDKAKTEEMNRFVNYFANLS